MEIVLFSPKNGSDLVSLVVKIAAAAAPVAGAFAWIVACMFCIIGSCTICCTSLLTVFTFPNTAWI